MKDNVCKVKDCKSVKTQHALAKKTNKICLHTLLVLKSGFQLESKRETEVCNKIDHRNTVNILLQKVAQSFPSMNDDALKDFLPKNNFI